MTTGNEHDPPPPNQPPAGPPPPVYGQQPGYPPQPGYPGYPQFAVQPNEGLAVPAMVVGIVSLVLACAYGFGLLGAPVALVMGRISMKRIDASGGQLGGRGMAQAGFIMGIVGTVLLVLVVLAVVAFVIAALNGAFDSSDF